MRHRPKDSLYIYLHIRLYLSLHVDFIAEKHCPPKVFKAWVEELKELHSGSFQSIVESPSILSSFLGSANLTSSDEECLGMCCMVTLLELLGLAEGKYRRASAKKRSASIQVEGAWYAPSKWALAASDGRSSFLPPNPQTLTLLL